MNVGVNTFGLRAPFYEDFDGALTTLKESGVTSLEVCVAFPSDPANMPDFPKNPDFNPDMMTAAIWPLDEAPDKIRYVREKGFRVISIHVMCFLSKPEELINIIPQMRELAEQTDVKYFVFSPMKSADELLAFAPAVRAVSDELANIGVEFLLHNHEKECELMQDGRTSMESLLELCPNLNLELDMGWAKFAGCDGPALMDKLGKRISLVHLKDITADACEENRNNCFTAIGEGSIPLERIIQKVQERKMASDTVIIDQDNSNDMLRDIRTGVANIQSFAK